MDFPFQLENYPIENERVVNAKYESDFEYDDYTQEDIDQIDGPLL